MLVKERMSRPAITIPPKMTIWEAHRLMKEEHVRRFPVVDKRGRLIGIVSESDILNASPSPATSLSIYEVNYLVSKITVQKVMTKEVITITEDAPLEEAARIMADSKIGGLPVVRNQDVVGIITETDLFKIFLELLGARESGVRLACLVPNTPEELSQLTKAIFDAGGNILTLGTFLGESSANREITLKADGITSQTLETAVEPFVESILDIRESAMEQ
jgi:acetoin utilization protein AcuB